MVLVDLRAPQSMFRYEEEQAILLGRTGLSVESKKITKVPSFLGVSCAAFDHSRAFVLQRGELGKLVRVQAHGLKLRRKNEKQCYVPSLEEYAVPFVKVGFELL